jgi:hypothetical protein
LRDADDFTNRWIAYGKVEGGEHQIFQEGGYLVVQGASRHEVEAEMNRMGFICRYKDNYVNPEQTIFIEDLHDQHVLVDSTDDLLIFDPVIYLAALGL